MNEHALAQALAALRGVRASRGYAALAAAERNALEHDLDRLERALGRSGHTRGAYAGAAHTADRAASGDPYAVPLETPADLARGRMGLEPVAAQPQPAPVQPPPRPAGTEVIGGRARQTLDAVDFPAFVAGLIRGTFQAIVDATTQQIREYALLVASLAQSVDGFSRSNVSPNQVRDWFAQRYPQDLVVVLPKTGEQGSPRLAPRRRRGEPPAWLAEFGLAGRDLDAELTEGELLEAGRQVLAEERMQTLATMVLMGVNRIVVSDGEIKAKLQFHASAREAVNADIALQGGQVQQSGIAARPTEAQTAVQTLVSTVSVNAQAEVAVRANLVGEVAIKFRSETFDLDRFADSQAIELINRHSRLNGGQPAAAAPAGTPTPAQAAP